MPSLASAAAPHITSVTPIFEYQASQYGRVVQMTLTGTDLAAPDTNGYSFPNDVKLLVRHSGDAFADSSSDMSSWSTTSLGLEFSSDKHKLNVVGTIDFQVVVRGVPSNIISVPIQPYPSSAPTINSIGPTSFLNTLPTQSDYLFRIYGKNTPEDATVAIGGQTLTFLAWADFAEGVIDVYVPANLRTQPGTYAVTVSSRSGTSNSVPLKIYARLKSMSERTNFPLQVAATPTPPLLLRTEPHEIRVPVNVVPIAGSSITDTIGRPTAPPRPQVAVLAPPVFDDGVFTQRYHDLDRKVSPSLRTMLTPTINAVASSLRSGSEAGAVGAADNGVLTARPSATPDQIAAMRVYVMTAALSMVGPSAGGRTTLTTVSGTGDAKATFRATLTERMQHVGAPQESALTVLR